MARAAEEISLGCFLVRLRVSIVVENIANRTEFQKLCGRSVHLQEIAVTLQRIKQVFNSRCH